ncbi:MAG: diguanylate cyclase [Inhella sp.]
MENLGFAHYNLRAEWSVLEQLRDFYVEVVGLQAGPRPPFASRGFWLYAGGQDVLHLSEARPGERREPHASGSFDHVAFRCRGLAACEQRLAGRGIAVRRSGVPGTGIVQLFLRDPVGNGVELQFEEAP